MTKMRMLVVGAGFLINVALWAQNAPAPGCHKADLTGPGGPVWECPVPNPTTTNRATSHSQTTAKSKSVPVKSSAPSSSVIPDMVKSLTSSRDIADGINTPQVRSLPDAQIEAPPLAVDGASFSNLGDRSDIDRVLEIARDPASALEEGVADDAMTLTRAAIREVVARGAQDAFGNDNYEMYRELQEVHEDIEGVSSGDFQKNVDGVFDLAEKSNDSYNSNPMSKFLSQIALPKIQNIYHNAAGIFNATMRLGSCISSSDPSCTDASEQLERQWDNFRANPLNRPLDILNSFDP